MPTSNFTAKLLELEEIIISDFTSSNTEIHIHFSLPRKACTCPHCLGLTDKVHDYRISIIKDLPIMGKHTFLHYRKRRYITVLSAANTFTSLFPWLQSIAVPLPVLLFMPFIYFRSDSVSVLFPGFWIYQIPTSFAG